MASIHREIWIDTPPERAWDALRDVGAIHTRLARGFVVDFLNVGVGPVRTGIFNVADVAIMAGAALMLIAELRAARDTP